MSNRLEAIPLSMCVVKNFGLLEYLKLRDSLELIIYRSYTVNPLIMNRHEQKVNLSDNKTIESKDEIIGHKYFFYIWVYLL